MASEEVKAITKAGEMVLKGLNDGFRAINVNLVDVANSLRKLTETGILATDDYWHPAIGSYGECPRPDYDWVLVKIRNDPKFLKGANGEVYNLPHIAEFRSDGKWWPLEWDDAYGTESVPFEVVCWRPIPGDNRTELYVKKGRCHSYE